MKLQNICGHSFFLNGSELNVEAWNLHGRLRFRTCWRNARCSLMSWKAWRPRLRLLSTGHFHSEDVRGQPQQRLERGRTMKSASEPGFLRSTVNSACGPASTAPNFDNSRQRSNSADIPQPRRKEMIGSECWVIQRQICGFIAYCCPFNII